MNLTDYVKTVSIEDFGWEFKHQALWNKRLRTTGGRFFPKDGHLDFNPKLYEEHGLETFRKSSATSSVIITFIFKVRATSMLIEILRTY